MKHTLIRDRHFRCDSLSNSFVGPGTSPFVSAWRAGSSVKSRNLVEVAMKNSGSYSAKHLRVGFWQKYCYLREVRKLAQTQLGRGRSGGNTTIGAARFDVSVH
jgi:hypothetical protein